MKQLSGIDNLFLSQEKPNQYMHVGALGLYDPSTAAGGKVRFKQVLEFFTSRLGASDIFRRRLVRPPFAMDRPYWIDCADFDVEYHVRHIGLPHPGDWRQLMIQIARIHSRPLDLTKPLWEAYIIEGLDNIPGIAKGSFALYIKIHHAAIDGEMGVEVISAIHTMQAEFDPASLHQSKTVIADREPNFLELAARAVGHRADQVKTASKLAFNLSRRAVDLTREYGPTALEKGEEWIGHYFNKEASSGKADASGKQSKTSIRPHTRFNEKISPHRVVDGIGFPMEDCKTIRRNVADVTINDIFMAVVGGAMQRYLASKGELPDSSMTAMVPVSTRGGVKGQDVGNQIGLTIANLKSDIEDPVERLLAVGSSSKTSKKVNSALGADVPMQLLDVLPGALTQKLMMYGVASSSNVTVSNVRGPDVPVYMAGAKLQMFMPISVSFEGSGLNVTGFSYDGTLWVAVTCCRAMMPDPAFFTDCLKEAFEELVAGALAHGKKSRKSSVMQPSGAAKKPAKSTLKQKPEKPSVETDAAVV